MNPIPRSDFLSRMPIHSVYKPAGYTPLQLIDALRAKDTSLANTPIVYAGRLDPMADGVLLLLSGEDRHRKDEFLTFEKTYRATFLFGASSDSFDALGRITLGSESDPEKVKKHLQRLLGSHALPYPAYSAYKVQGKPLHWWASEGRLEELNVPVKQMHVQHLENISISRVDSNEIRKDVTDRIALIQGSFRQSETLSDWQRVLSQEGSFLIASATLTVTSGTYIRSLAQLLGEEIGCGALLLRLTRTSVGPYALEDAERLFPYNQSI